MGAPQRGGPSFITPGDNAHFFGTQDSAQWFRVFNGNFYAFAQGLQTGTPGVTACGMFKSTNNGASWTELDAAHHPVGVGTTWFDQPNSQFICALDTHLTSTPGPIFLINFNLLTETWGAQYATSGSPSALGTFFIFQRPDTTFVIIWSTTSPPPPTTSRLRASIWNGSAWGSQIDIAQQTVAFGGVFPSSVCADMEPATGVIHLAYASAAAAGTPSTADYFYQKFNADNSLGTAAHFTAASLGLSRLFANIVIYNGSVYIPFAANSNNDNRYLVGTPLSAPVFSEVAPPNLLGLGTIDQSAMMATDGITLYWMIGFSFLTNYQVYSSTDGTNWTVIPDQATAPYFYSFTAGSPIAPGANLGAGTLAAPLFVLRSGTTTTLYGFSTVNQNVGGFSAYFMNFEPLGAPAPLPNVQSQVNGGGPYVIPKPCLCDITDLAWMSLYQMRQRQESWPYVWSFPPPGAIRVFQQGSVAVPTVAAGETEGTNYTVPQGFQFVLFGIVVEFLRSGNPALWNPGQMLWNLDINRPVGVGTFQGQTLEGFTKVDVPLGALQPPFSTPWFLHMPELLSSNDTLRSKFFNVSLSTGAGNFLKTVFIGWRFPA